jgi:hypothetical protein
MEVVDESATGSVNLFLNASGTGHGPAITLTGMPTYAEWYVEGATVADWRTQPWEAE